MGKFVEAIELPFVCIAMVDPSVVALFPTAISVHGATLPKSRKKKKNVADSRALIFEDGAHAQLGSTI